MVKTLTPNAPKLGVVMLINVNQCDRLAGLTSNGIIAQRFRQCDRAQHLPNFEQWQIISLYHIFVFLDRF